MSEYGFILDNLKFSYSSVNSFDGCAYGFRLSYIDASERIGNAFSDYGTLIHEILEKYFRGEFEVWDLPEYFKNNYVGSIKNPFPNYPVGMEQSYFDTGLKFFENFSFDKSLYNIIFIEDKIDSLYNGINLVVKPDLILQEKETNEYILIDYKTAKMKTSKPAFKKQIDDYMKQFNLYIYFLWLEREIEISKVKIWFIRDGKEHCEIVDPIKVQETVDWFENTIKKIKEETDWTPNLSKENEYFCRQICSFRTICKYNLERETK